MYPVTTTIIQNTVAPHQLGTATGTLNFARQLGGAIIVAAFGAIVLGGIDTGGHGLTLGDAARRRDAGAASDFATVFGWLFAAAAVFLAAGFVAVLAIEERPLRGPTDTRGEPRRRGARGVVRHVAVQVVALVMAQSWLPRTNAVEIAQPKRDIAVQH